MTNYSHAHFSARTPRAFRSGLLNAINADFRLDAASVADDENLSHGVLRHTLTINGRQIGYEAALNAEGNFVVTALEDLPPHRGGKSLDQIKAVARDRLALQRFVAAIS